MSGQSFPLGSKVRFIWFRIVPGLGLAELSLQKSNLSDFKKGNLKIICFITKERKSTHMITVQVLKINSWKTSAQDYIAMRNHRHKIDQLHNSSFIVRSHQDRQLDWC
jgi:hypothetical protein